MNYWRRWIGAWRKKTRSLTHQQRGIYAELLDEYYANEKPLPADRQLIYRLVAAMTKAEQADVDLICLQFFIEREGWIYHEKGDEEIKAWKDFCASQAKRRLGWRKPAADGVIHKDGNGAWWKSRAGIEAKGSELGLPPRRGEEMPEYKDRLFAAINAAKG